MDALLRRGAQRFRRHSLGPSRHACLCLLLLQRFVGHLQPAQVVPDARPRLQFSWMNSMQPRWAEQQAAVPPAAAAAVQDLLGQRHLK